MNEPYWFHVHTNVTDGSLSIEEVFKQAHARGVKTLVFLEHIRREPTYDVSGWETEVRLFAEEYRLDTLVGFEAKILPEGELDIDPEDFERADLIGIAEHGFPENLTLFMDAWEEVMDDAATWCKKKPAVWVHPGLFFRKYRLIESHFDEYKMLLQKAHERGVHLEYNLRYNLMERSLLGEYPHLTGIDLHQESDIARWEQFAAKEMMASA
ncbi:MAG: PHP domain-containing protein [Chlamydiia bacterium]|nr:PHP domain-containing protein [Chlamydiia bacterium]